MKKLICGIPLTGESRGSGFTKNEFFSSLSGVTLFACGVTNAAFAQTEAGANLVLEETVVTARRFEENLQDTPVSVTAFSAGTLEALGVANLISVDTYTPNVSIGGGLTSGADVAVFSIRGITQPQGAIATDPAVGLYIDDVYYPRAHGALLDIIDIERIEVLRGPQGTLFGKNTSGGAIRYITKRPSDELEFEATATVGNFDRVDVSAIANIPLTDNLSGRFVFASKERGGYVTRVIDGIKTGDEDVSATRGQLQWQPNDAWLINLAADYLKSEDNGPPRDIPVIDPNSFFPVSAMDPAFTAGLVTPDRFTVLGGDIPDSTAYEAFGMTLTAEWSISDKLSIKSLSGYRSGDQQINVDWDLTPSRIFRNEEDVDFDYYSQEIQFNGLWFNDRLNWVAGLYYLNETPTERRDRVFAVFVPDVTQMQFRDLDTESYAVFGQGTFSITEQFSLTAGVRWSEDTKDFFSSEIISLAGPGVISGAGEESWTSTTPRISLEYRWNEALMTYVSTAKGFKAGGFNDRIQPGAVNSGILPYEPETLWTFEAGFRADWLDRRVRLNGTGFYTDYQDLQVQIVLFPPGGGPAFPFIQNAGEASVRGAEIEALALVTDSLALRGTFGWTDAQYDELGGAQGVTLASEFARTPEYSYSIGGTYTYPLDTGGETAFHLDWGWKDSQRTNNTDSNSVIIDSYGLLNARFEYTAPDERWSVAVFGTNITDEVYLISGFDSAIKEQIVGIVQHDLGRPAEYGVTLKFRY